MMGERGPEVQDGIVTMLITRQQIPQCFLLACKMRVPWRPLCDPQRSGSAGLGRLQSLICSLALRCSTDLFEFGQPDPSLPVPWEAFQDVKCWNTKLGWFWVKAGRLLWNLGACCFRAGGVLGMLRGRQELQHLYFIYRIPVTL